MPTPAYRYAATIVRWVDADTVDIDLDLGFKIRARQRVRLRTVAAGGIDAPERNTPAGQRAKARCEEIAPPGAPVTLHSHELDKYGRALGAIVTDHDVDIAAELVAEGHALPWDGVGEKPGKALTVGEGSR